MPTASDDTFGFFTEDKEDASEQALQEVTRPKGETRSDQLVHHA